MYLVTPWCYWHDASNFRFRDRSFQFWLCTTAYWPWANYLHLYASVTITHVSVINTETTKSMFLFPVIDVVKLAYKSGSCVHEQCWRQVWATGPRTTQVSFDTSL